MKVTDLLHAVGKKLGIDPQIIDNMDLDNVVERAIAIQEGRPPPPDTDELPEMAPLLEKRSDSPKFIDDEPPPLPENSPPASDPPSRSLDFPTVIYDVETKIRDLEEMLVVEITMDDENDKYPSVIESPISLHPVEELEQYPLVTECPLPLVPNLSESPVVLLHSEQIRILIEEDEEERRLVESESYDSSPEWITTKSAPQSSMTSPQESNHIDQREVAEAEGRVFFLTTLSPLFPVMQFVLCHRHSLFRVRSETVQRKEGDVRSRSQEALRNVSRRVGQVGAIERKANRRRKAQVCSIVSLGSGEPLFTHTYTHTHIHMWTVFVDD